MIQYPVESSEFVVIDLAKDGRREFFVEQSHAPSKYRIVEKSGFGGSGTGVDSTEGEPTANPRTPNPAIASIKAITSRPVTHNFLMSGTPLNSGSLDPWTIAAHRKPSVKFGGRPRISPH